MTPYADTNFYTRAYLETPESRLITNLAETAERTGASGLPVSWFLRLEFCNALQLHVFQGRVGGQQRVTAEQAAAALAGFRDDLQRETFLRAVSLATGDLERQFEELSLRHTARHGFRTYDLLHISSALVLKCDTFWSFDSKANELARLEGLRTLNGAARK